MRTFTSLVFAFVLFIALQCSAFASPKVIIIGGGVGGLSAAHELAERGFKVQVFEMRDIAGGKARSVPVPGSATDTRKDLPGEHGFRFFPGFYAHITDTMKRIPYPGNRRGTYDNLVPAHRIGFFRKGRPVVVVPSHPPKNFEDFKALVKLFVDGGGFGIPQNEVDYFTKRLYMMATSSDERRYSEWENISWWDYIGAGSRSPEYQKYLAIGLTRSLVATKAELTSARTCGTILLQLMFNTVGIGGTVDRVLNGPTNEVWIDPWVKYLKNIGVDYQLNAKVESIDFDGKKIQSIVVRQGNKIFSVKGDYFISAVPVEAMLKLTTSEMVAADPALGRLNELRTEWMTGMQFYLKKDLPLANGHGIYYDSPWALTTISQKQFWPGIDLAGYGDGKIRGILSVDISDWNTPGILYGKPAKHCTKNEIKNEVLAQLKLHWDAETVEEVEKNLVTWFLDPGITFSREDSPENADPLLINTAGSWANRPEAYSAIPNLFFASDYVRTYMDLASMEAANEAARRAVNELLSRSGSKAKRCKVKRLMELPVFFPERLLDEQRFKRGLKHRLEG